MGALDKLIAAVSPKTALARAQASYALEQLQMVRAYEGAKVNRRNAGWRTTSGSANAEILPALQTLRNRSRSLVRDNVYARRAIDVLVNAMIGSGVTPKFADTVSKDRFNAWSRECDADGLTDFNGLLKLIERTAQEAGECLVRFRIRRAEDGLTIPLQLQVLEPDHLDLNKTEALSGGRYIQGGIQFDAIGRRMGYWLFPEHPGEVSVGFRRLRSESVFVSADEVIHYFKRERASQIRGVPRLAVAINRLRDIDDYQDAELVRKKIESCFSVFVTRNDGVGGLTDLAAGGKRAPERISPGAITQLSPGESVTFGAPAAVGGYAEYVRTELRAIASGIGVTYEQMTGDLSGVNYSSIRAGMNEFRRNIEADQWTVLVPSLLNPIMLRLATISTIAGRPIQPPLDWGMPKPSTTDPLKDALADKELVRGGMKSLSQCIRELGYDRDAVFAEIAKDMADLKKLNITVDTDSAVTEGIAAKLLETAAREETPIEVVKEAEARNWARVIEILDRI